MSSWKVITGCLLFISTDISAQHWDWVTGPEENFGEQKARRVAIDHEGNIFLSGSQTSTSKFGEYQADSSNFIIKFNPQGEVIDIHNINFPVSYLFTSSSGIYLAGSYQGSITLGSKTYSSAGFDDSFIARMDKDFNIVWSREITGPGFENIQAITISNDEEILAAISYDDGMKFNDLTYVEDTLKKLLVVKMGAMGNILNTRDLSFDKKYEDLFIEPIENKEFYLTIGRQQGQLISGNENLVTSDYTTGLIMKLDSDLNIQSITSSGDNGYITSFAATKENIYYVKNSGNTSFFSATLVKEESNRNISWEKPLGDELQPYCLSRNLMKTKNGIYLNGYSGMHSHSDSIMLDGKTVHNHGGVDILVAGFMDEGSVSDLYCIGGKWDDYITNMATDEAGNLYITGFLMNSQLSDEPDKLKFGDKSMVTASNNGQIFLAKLSFEKEEEIDNRIKDQFIIQTRSDGLFIHFPMADSKPELKVFASTGALVYKSTSLKPGKWNTKLKNGMYYYQFSSNNSVVGKGNFIVIK